MRFAVMVLGGLALTLGIAHAQKQEKAMSPAIERGATVQLEYTLSDENGKVLQSNKGRDPLTYTHGDEQLLPALEKAMAGMRAGEERKVTLKPEEGYGPVDPAAQAEVPKAMLPPNALSVGTELVARGPGGTAMPVRIKEIKEATVVLDLNHPLAGKTLHFDIKILGVESPKK